MTLTGRRQTAHSLDYLLGTAPSHWFLFYKKFEMGIGIFELKLVRGPCWTKHLKFGLGSLKPGWPALAHQPARSIVIIRSCCIGSQKFNFQLYTSILCASGTLSVDTQSGSRLTQSVISVFLSSCGSTESG